MLFSLTNPEIAILMMVIFLFAVLLGFTIAFTLKAMGVGFGYYAYFDPTRMEHLLDNIELPLNNMAHYVNHQIHKSNQHHMDHQR